MSPHGWDGPVGFWRCEWPWKTQWFSLSAFALIALVHHRLFDLGADVCTGPDKCLKTWSSAHGSYRVCMLRWQCTCCASTSIILEVKHDLGVGEEWDFLFLPRPWRGGCGTGMWHTHGDLLTSALVTGRLVLFPLRLWEHLLPQNHVSHGGRSCLLLKQQSNLKITFFFLRGFSPAGV